jgi:hypothetical protein
MCSLNPVDFLVSAQGFTSIGDDENGKGIYRPEE